MAEGLLFGVAVEILKKLGSSALQEIGLWWGVKDEIELLDIKVVAVKVMLLDAEDRLARGDDSVKGWLDKLKIVLYDADDLLDDFSTEVLQRRVMTGNSVAREVRLFFSSSNRLAYGLKMGHKIKAIRKRLDVVMDAGRHFNFRQPPADTSTLVMPKKREQTHSSPPKVVVGREDDEKKIRQLLLSESYEKNVTVISIIGIGGLGKTCLAQRIYEDVKSQFELKVWICVSDNFSVTLTIKKILESINKECPKMESLDPLKDSLHKEINGKKYLLVLDDIWDDALDYNGWSDLADLLNDGARGSRILITTRCEKIARIACPAPLARYALKGLSEDESWCLFVKMAFKGCAPPTPMHEEIGREIVAKCGGVPLAIRAIGGLLYSEEMIFGWERFKGKELARMDQEGSNIMETLKLSYYTLPPHLKQCFAYCSLFPKDHEIDVDKLVALWMAQGYIDASECLEDIGRKYFMDLLWRSFFQDAEKDEYGNIVSCKMHDLMHDLACEVTGDESTYVSISSPIVGKKTRHISFYHFLNGTINDDTWQVPVSVLQAKSLRTFLAPHGYDDEIGEGQCHVIFRNLRRLRQLDLDTETVPDSIRKMKQLRYLDLSWNDRIKMLSRSITRLQNLQVLNLRQCWELRQLPKDIKKLVSLKRLDIRYCDALTHMPRGIGQSTSLERLTRFVLPKSKKQESESGGLGELHDLNKLGGELWIENLPHRKSTATPTTTSVAETCAAANVNLREKPRLQVLGLHWLSLEDFDDVDINEDEMSLEALRPHPNLKRLRVENCGGINFAWLSSLTNLVTLWLHSCRKCRILPALDQIPSLKEIAIEGLTDLEYIDMDIRSCCAGGGGVSATSSSDNNSMVSFVPSLEKMTLGYCPNLKGWRPSSSSLLPQFQRLSVLCIRSCPNLTSMPSVSPSLETLETAGSFKSLEQMLKGTISPAHGPSSSSLPSNVSSSLTGLQIANIEHLPEDFLPVELLQTLTSLKSLWIGRCPTLTSLPHAKMLLLTSLEYLEIIYCENLDLSNYDDDGNNNNDAIPWQGQSLKSLADLHIQNIPKLVHLPRRLLLHSIALRSLVINNCPNLASLPEWMPNLTSLQALRIYYCFQLSERCNNNKGEDWPTIAHIRFIVVDGRVIQYDGCYQL